MMKSAAFCTNTTPVELEPGEVFPEMVPEFKVNVERSSLMPVTNRAVPRQPELFKMLPSFIVPVAPSRTRTPGVTVVSYLAPTALLFSMEPPFMVKVAPSTVYTVAIEPYSPTLMVQLEMEPPFMVKEAEAPVE